MRDPEFQDRLDLPLLIDGEGGKSSRPGARPNVWRRLSRVMEVVIYVLLALVVYKLFGPELDRQDELKGEKKRLEQIRNEREEQVVRLRQEHRLMKTDREYLETIARDRLDLQREGEFVIRIDRGEEE